jgi:hypothetical protein
MRRLFRLGRHPRPVAPRLDLASRLPARAPAGGGRARAPLAAGLLALPLALLAAAPGCASHPPATTMAAVGKSPRVASVDRAKASMRARDWTAARDALERAQDDASTPEEMADVTYWRATLAAYRGDLAGAARLLEADFAIWEPARGVAHAYWRLNALTWIDWADHRLTDALARIDRSGAWIASSTLPEDGKRALLRHYAWDRAYVLVDLASAASRPERAAIDRALAARDTYARMAEGVDAPSSLDVLDLHVMDLTHDTARAAEIHARMAGASLDDVQDLYVLRAAQLRDARFADAAVTEEKIVRFPEPYLMHALVLRAMSAGSLDPPP